MELQAIVHADYLDILFDNRNKKYGGYELRKNYERRMFIAIFSVVAATALLSLYSSISNNGREHLVAAGHITIQPIEPAKLIYELPVKKPEPPSARRVKPTVANPVPIIVADNKVITPPKTLDDLKVGESGKADVEGDSSGLVPATTTVTGSGMGKVITGPVAEPRLIAEEMPEFSGNLVAYLGRNMNYPAAARESGIEGKVVLQFVVNEDGGVSNVKIVRSIGGGCDEEAVRVVKNMPKWKPGRQNGRAVKVYYTLPIRFTLQ